MQLTKISTLSKLSFSAYWKFNNAESKVTVSIRPLHWPSDVQQLPGTGRPAGLSE